MNANWTDPFWSASLFVVYIVTSCFGLYLIKVAESWETPSFSIGFALYCAGAIIWMVILRLVPLSFAFPIAAGALMICTVLIGAFFLGETVTAWHIAGTLMIITGIALIAANR